MCVCVWVVSACILLSVCVCVSTTLLQCQYSLWLGELVAQALGLNFELCFCAAKAFFLPLPSPPLSLTLSISFLQPAFSASSLLPSSLHAAVLIISIRWQGNISLHLPPLPTQVLATYFMLSPSLSLYFYPLLSISFSLLALFGPIACASYFSFKICSWCGLCLRSCPLCTCSGAWNELDSLSVCLSCCLIVVFSLQFSLPCKTFVFC